MSPLIDAADYLENDPNASPLLVAVLLRRYDNESKYSAGASRGRRTGSGHRPTTAPPVVLAVS